MSLSKLLFPPIVTTSIELDVNGQAIRLEVEPRTHLADALREQCGLTATHIGCEHGVCGACTIEVDGAPQRSCLNSAVRFVGRQVRTLEAFASGGREIGNDFGNDGEIDGLVHQEPRRASA